MDSKSIKIGLLVLAAALVAAGCGKEQEVGGSGRTLSVVSSDLVFQPDGGRSEFQVEAAADVSVMSDRAWCEATVSGKTVSVAVGPNAGVESRYARLTLTSGTESLGITVIQYGEVVVGLDIDNIIVPAEGDTVAFDLKVNVAVTLESDQPWIHPRLEPGRLTVGVERNDGLSTRTGTVTYRAGSVTGRIEVLQNPPYVRTEDWELAFGEAYYEYPDFRVPGIVTAPAEDLYVLYCVPRGSITGDFETWIFSVLAVSARRDLMERLEAGEGTSFGDLLYAGSRTVVLDGAEVGSNFLVAIGFGENGYVTGKYQYLEGTVTDVRPPYFKWVGNWSVSRKNNNYDTTDTWVISIKDLGRTLNIHGIEGFDNPSRYDAEATVDETTGELVVVTQDCGAYDDSSRGRVTVRLSGEYTTASGSTYYSATLNLVLLRGTLSRDGTSAGLSPGTVISGGNPYPFNNLQFYGRYTNASGGTSAFSWNAGPTQLPQTITRLP